MKLPNYQHARVPQSKITDYLLSATHADGSSKAAFFTRFGFDAQNWQTLADALLRPAAENQVTRVEASPFGTRFIIEGIIKTPDGINPQVRSVWFAKQRLGTKRISQLLRLSPRIHGKTRKANARENLPRIRASCSHRRLTRT